MDRRPDHMPPKVNFEWINEAWDIYRTAWIPWSVLFIIPVLSHIIFALHTFTNPQVLALVSFFRTGNSMSLRTVRPYLLDIPEPTMF